jgi:hypothetical protein
MARGRRSNPTLAKAFAVVLSKYQGSGANKIPTSELARQLHVKRQTIYTYFQKENPAAPTRRVLARAVQLGMEVDLGNGYILRKENFVEVNKAQASPATQYELQFGKPMKLTTHTVVVTVTDHPGRLVLDIREKETVRKG